VFDDYAHKHTSKKIGFRFVQEKDEPMYPWEIAGFLTKLNTVYYKYELLNSICSALNNGIPASEIFIFGNSLPLYKRYADLDYLSEFQAAQTFYPVGLPYPLTPTADIYEFNLLYQAFAEVNSFLRTNHVYPLLIASLSVVYETLKSKGLDEAEEHILELADDRARKSHENSMKKKAQREPLNRDALSNCLKKYRVRKARLLEDLALVHGLNDSERLAATKSTTKEDKRRTQILLKFFRLFDKTARPLVCARVSPGRFLVLGRSLVNKREKSGLELKELARHSPLKGIFEGGVAVYQAIQQEKRAKELHQFDLESRRIQNELALQQVEAQQLRNLSLKANVAKELHDLAETSDIKAISQLSESFEKIRLLDAYINEEKNATSLMNRRGLRLDGEYTKVIDTSA